jgi:hypothetical protein
VPDAEGVVLAFDATREAGHAVLHAQSLHPGAAPGQGLVRIGLVADIPHQAILGRVEHVVQGNGQLDGTEVGREVAAGLGHRFQHEGAQLIGHLGHLFAFQRAQFRGGVDLVEQRVGHQKVRSTMKSVSSCRRKAESPKDASASWASCLRLAAMALAWFRPRIFT